jgi:hypothetical protein
MPRTRNRPAAAWLAAWFLAAPAASAWAQTRVAPVEGFSAPASPAIAAPVSGVGTVPTIAPGLLSGPSLNAAPSASIVNSPAAALTAAPAAAASEARAFAAPALSPAPGLAAPVSALAAETVAAPASAASPESVSFPISDPAASVRGRPSPVRGVIGAREAAALATIENGAASWENRGAQALGGGSVRAAASDGVRPLISAEWPDAPAPKPAPDAPAPDGSRARPRLARAALYSGAVLVAASAVSFFVPALIPAALSAAKGPAIYAGFALLSLSRLWRTPTTAAPRGPPSATGPAAWARRAWARISALDARFAEWTGRHGPTLSWGTRLLRAPVGLVMWPVTALIGTGRSMLSTWGTARVAADSQAKLEARVGAASADSFRDWFIGGLRAAAVWVPLALGGMLVGWGIAKPFAHLVKPDDMVGMLSFDTLEKFGLGGHLLGYVASGFAAQAVSLGVFDVVRALSAKLGAGRASAWIGGAAALALSAGLILMVTTTPSVIGSMLGIEAAVLWLRTRSKSWLAPLALRGIFSLLILEAARLGVGLVGGGAAGATLAGLPAFAGIAVTGMLAAGLVWAARGARPSALWAALKAQLARVGEFGRSWHAPRHDGAPHSPWPLFQLAALWGTILYATGDLVYAAIHFFTGGTEPTPPALAQMLTSPIDLVLYNFLLVGFLEEFVFRRGLFKAVYGRFKKWGLTSGRLFWSAAILSGLLFSGAHYIDFGAIMAKFGMADATTASGLGGMYAFTLGGFTARAALGVVLAWLYAESGTLFLPILAHFAADSLEGLGLHLGFVPFLAMIAGALAIQRVWNQGRTQRS